MASKPKTRPKKRAKSTGCSTLLIGCVVAPISAAFFVIVALLVAIPFALRREPLEPIEFTLEAQGAPWPKQTTAVASYRSVLEPPALPALLQPALAQILSPKAEIPAVTLDGDRLALSAPAAYTSIRSERLFEVRVGSIRLSRTESRPKADLPPLTGDIPREDNPLLYAALDGPLARLTANAAFLPDPILVPDQARRVAISISTEPVVLTGFRTGVDGLGWKSGAHEGSGAKISGRELTVPAGQVVPIPLYRTGVQGFPPRAYRAEGEVATHVIAINEEILVETIGWRLPLQQIPLTADELDTLYTLRDPTFPTAVELVDGQPAASIAVPPTASGSVALLAFSIHASDTLAGAGYLRLSVTSPPPAGG